MAAFLNPPQEVRGFPSAEEVWDALQEHKREVVFSKFLARIDGQADKFMELIESVAYWIKKQGHGNA
jgi:hypothetical protein